MITISRFAALTRASVVEHIETEAVAWLEHLTRPPAESWAGQYDESGWSPVVFDPPARSKENVRRVFALVLDHDKGGDWDRVCSLWQPYRGAVYTTKSHGAPGTVGDRLRVVLPLSRHVTAEEYSRLWEWAAWKSSACPIDKQCKDPSRFWYDPTLPPGGWRAHLLRGQPLDPDAALAETVPQPAHLRVVRPPAASAPTDREKRARAWLARVPGAVQGSDGSTSTFNAVASVMFGFDLDEATAERVIWNDFNPRCEPPWSEAEIAHKIRSVAQKCTRARGYLLVDRPRITTSTSAAAYAPPAAAELDVDWAALLLVKKDRSPRSGYHNVAVFIRHHPDYRGKWSLNEMTAAPWYDGRPVPDTMIHELRAAVDAKLGFSPGREDVEAAVSAAAAERPFHPIRQYLRSVDWDGHPRLCSLARDYLSTSSAVHGVMLRKFMIGAVARALAPGCKHDTALMLVGAQGLMKSSFLATLGGEWHSDSAIDINNKDAFLQLHGSWLYEFAELENVVQGRAESRLKAFMSSAHDTFRPPYGRTAVRRARSVVLCGSTNHQRFLTDDTGSRRFWIVEVTKHVPIARLVAERDQLWAEAVAAYESGEQWWLDAESDHARETANEAHMEDDVWAPAVGVYLERHRLTKDGVTVSTVLEDACKVDRGRQDRWSEMRVSKILKRARWRRQFDRIAKQWAYVPPIQPEVGFEVGS